MVKSRREQLKNTPINANFSEGLVFDEQDSGFGADHVAAGNGIIWVNNNTPNRLIFTNENGSDHILSGGGATFASPTALAAFDATDVHDFATVWCGTVNDAYQLVKTPSPALLAASDGVNVVAAAAPADAVWIRKFTRNLAAQYETEWFLDAVNGSDANSGTNALSPLRTMRELSARLNGAKIAQNVTVTLAAGDYSADQVSFELDIAQGFSVLMSGSVTSTTDVIASILSTTPGASSTNVGAQRGTLTATALNVASSDDRRRLRLTDGASVGAMAFVTKVVTPGVGGVVNTTRWGRLTSPLTSTTVTNITPTPGTGFSIDTLNSQIGALNLRVRGAGRFVITDCLIRPGGTSTVTHRCLCDNGNANGVLTYGCIFQSAATTLFQSGNWTQAVCSISSDLGNIVYSGVSFAVARMCVWTGVTATPNFTLNVQNMTAFQSSEGACIDGGTLVLASGAVWDQIGQTNNDMQYVDGSGTRACEVAQGGHYRAHSSTNRQWGLDNSFSTSTFIVSGRYDYNTSAVPSVPGGATDVNVGGTTAAYADLPIIKTTAAAGTTASTGAPASMVSS
jgi:hypothetical protein